MKKYVYYMLLLIVLGNGVSCSSGYDDSFWEEIMDIPGGNGMGNGNGLVSDDGDIPTFDATISEWNGEMAEDAHLDVVGTDKDFYYELNTFINRVTMSKITIKYFVIPVVPMRQLICLLIRFQIQRSS